MNSVDLAWTLGQPTVGGVFKLITRARSYGAERVPLHGGLVLAINHFSWLDPPAIASIAPRPIYYMAKIEATKLPGIWQFVRAFGTFSVRRGESDRDAVRTMRQIVRDGNALGLFVEGTRQRSGVPGEAQPGAAMVAIQEDVPVVPVAIEGTQRWKASHPVPVSVAWGEPMRFDGLPRNAKGYRAASVEIQDEIRKLWDFLVEVHRLGRPKTAVPPSRALAARG
jgi:1-acyl-sn-glycerol-3-phosphate acyltransferase